MSQESLTARYRPQSFASVAGQDAVKRILSRAAATNRVAPAYLFSGTRGVGKTTLARIFAKALNCLNGPAEEPCNQCPVCRQITLGAAVDVVEIDGASNTGVDNVRRLKEDVGYAPLECRYKVIIIDEAHMLSKAAFNALLKTLEEPPGHVTFIMATTEPEKFPQTIISRCQHFVFKRLPQADLVRHLEGVLAGEGLGAEHAAVTLIARRGAGSVRDSMSLLGQVLALGSESLTVADVREVLGLTGSEMFVRLVECVHARDLTGLHALLTEVLDQGADLGFFLRELAGCWRNLFLFNQLGEAARGLMDLPAEEVDVWAGLAPRFSLGHLHAAWQMTMDSQRKVLTSMEPALALELLLLNLACLPDLLALGTAGPARGASGPATQGAQASQTSQVSQVSQPPRPAPARPQSAPPRPAQSHAAQPHVSPPSAPPAAPAAAPAPSRGQQQFSAPPAESVAPAQTAAPRREPPESSRPAAPAASAAMVRETPAGFGARPEAPAMPAPPDGPRTWAGFVAFCGRRPEGGRPLPALDKARGEMRGSELVLTSPHGFLCDRLNGCLPMLTELARAYFGPGTGVRVEEGVQEVRKTRAELKELAQADPVVRQAQEKFQARIVEVRPPINGKAQENEI